MGTPGLDACLSGLTAFVALAILVSGLDDFFVDCCYWADRGWRGLRYARRPRLTETALRAAPEQPLAVMIPAWHEDAVIGKMLGNTLRTVDYHNYEVFVGTYPNDEPTRAAVAAAAAADPRIHNIVCPHDGPTNKADCLNWIIAGVRLFERASGRAMKIFVLHDSEDMIHPLSFKLINYFIPRFPMVQLPVIPLEAPLSHLTAGSYLDEFAESHVKDMRVRERLTGMVPSAGVGTGFSSRALARLARRHRNQIFNVATFTEDYDLAFRLRAIGGRSALLQFRVDRALPASSGERRRVVRELVGTREFFPASLRDAVRQKARWTLGIVFHGWQQRGWEGGLAMRYMIWRDRKTLITNSVNMLGYALILGALTTWWLLPRPDGRCGWTIRPWVWSVILLDTALLANRCLQRMLSVARVSDWRQALVCPPRIVWGNVVNFGAVLKATALFLGSAVMGRKLVWAKTEHAFPSEDQLAGFACAGSEGDARRV